MYDTRYLAITMFTVFRILTFKTFGFLQSGENYYCTSLCLIHAKQDDVKDISKGGQQFFL